MKMHRCLAAAISALLLLVHAGGTAALTIEKVLPFATDHEVRVQMFLKSDTPGPVSLAGSIEQVTTATVSPLWTGSLGEAEIRGDAATAEHTVSNLKPQLWSPGSPTLYNLTVTAKQGRESVSQTVRIGFRSLAARTGQVLLNGKPIFLKGIAINPPKRDIPDEVGYSRQFAYDYVRFLRSYNVNLIRLTFDFEADPRHQAWFDACDELGMMVYQGTYGAPPATAKGGPSFDPEEQTEQFAGKDRNAPRTSKSAPPEDFEASLTAYKDVFETYLRHPSIIIYVLSNELPGPVLSNPEWHDFLVKMDEQINQWDPTRLVIGNAGYGLGREGDLNDVHRYWGWYYNSFLTYYNLRNSVELFGAPTDLQPLTFSECVGSFTSPLGTFNLIFKKQLAAQLCWTGHSAEQAPDALAHQAFVVKHALESFRTMREQNHRLAGLMPFTILFYNWEGIQSFAEMKPKPAMDQMAVSYAPILTSIELWTPQVYAGTNIRPIIHVVNDSENFAPLRDVQIDVQLLTQQGRQVAGMKFPLPELNYYEARSFPVDMKVPQIPTGEYLLFATIEQQGRAISRNQEVLYVAAERPVPANRAEGILLYDPKGHTGQALNALGISTQPVKELARLSKSAKAVIVGEHSLAGGSSVVGLREFIARGGRVLCLAQKSEAFDTSWLPARIQMLNGTATDPTYPPKIRPTADQQNINPERPWHPIFNGIERRRMRLWSDYTGWDQSKPGFPRVFPVTNGFKLLDANELGKVAIIADYDRGLEGIAIAEMFQGRGSVVLSGLDLINRAGRDPVADRMLMNLVAYLASPEHEVLPLIDKPIIWGNYPTERGVLTGPVQGLVYNCRWVPPPTAPNAIPMPDNGGMWNSHPGNPFVTVGIRAFGPFTWSTGASPREESKDETGTGVFTCRVPAGRTVVTNKVQNREKTPLNMQVSVNGVGSTAEAVPPGQTVIMRTPIPNQATDLAITFTGAKELVILETSFQ